VGPDIPFTAGARASFFLPELPGYQAYPGSDLDGMYDYPCSYSPESSECRLTGSTEEIAHICSADPRCKGFVYIPTEIGLTAKPLGILKGGASMEVISPAFLVVNPSTAVYLQEATFNEVVSEGNASSLLGGSGQYTNATDNNNSSSTSNAMIGWMALSVALAILFAGIAIIAVAFAVMAHRRAKAQDKRSSALLQQFGSSSCSGSPPLSGTDTLNLCCSCGQPRTKYIDGPNPGSDVGCKIDDASKKNNPSAESSPHSDAPLH